MKKICIIVFFLIILTSFNLSQFKKYQYIRKLNFKKENFSLGYYLTTNLFTFNINSNITKLQDKDTLGFVPIVIPEIGFSIGLINNFHFNNYFDLRFEPVVHVTKRQLNLRYMTNYLNMKYLNNLNALNFISSDIIVNINSVYLDFPFFIKLNGNLYNNYRPYFMNGISCMLNLTPYDNFIKNYKISSIFKFKKVNFTFQSEIGIEVFFNNIKLTPALKGIIFLNNELINNTLNIKKSNYLFNLSKNLQFITSQVWLISIKFE